jgi:hypothetical protein
MFKRPKNKYLKTKRTSKLNLEPALVTSKSADSVPKINFLSDSHVLPVSSELQDSPPQSYRFADEETQEDVDGNFLSESFPALDIPFEDDLDIDLDSLLLPKSPVNLNLDDMLMLHVLGPPALSSPRLSPRTRAKTGFSGTEKICLRCKLNIPDGASSILFHNRNYHPKCYVCSHCHCTLLDQSPVLKNQELLCDNCHIVL